MFQFTHPGKGATDEFEELRRKIIKFQFTHPGKGATPSSITLYYTEKVSIHAPWEGCDPFALS